MALDKYKPNPDYDNTYVTQLLDNYRSHSAILQFSNQRFYGSRLRAKASPDVNAACGWYWLPKENFPVIFHSVLGTSQKEEDGSSSFNLAQISVIGEYL